MEPAAVLWIAQFVVSIFQIQQGAPAQYQLPYASMEECQKYEQIFNNQQQLDTEWSIITRSKCFTFEEFQEITRQQQAQQAAQQQDSE